MNTKACPVCKCLLGCDQGLGVSYLGVRISYRFFRAKHYFRIFIVLSDLIPTQAHEADTVIPHLL